MGKIRSYLLSDEELITELRDPENPSKIQHEGLQRRFCLLENIAQGKAITGDEFDAEGKKEATFLYHPDSRLICVHGKNRIGLDGVLKSKADKDQHRKLWCKYHPCENDNDAQPIFGRPGEGKPNNNETLLILISGISSSCIFIIIILMFTLFKKRRYNY